ncbi:hypothetical protein TNCV_4583281 [Trichonephila clavipes]|nr:hypothetical protein TNCV_4583281 [Trichonephila clavipes]
MIQIYALTANSNDANTYHRYEEWNQGMLAQQTSVGRRQPKNKNSINLKYEAISVPQGSVRLVKKTQERKSSTCYLLITKGVTSSSPVPLKTHRVGERCTLNLSRAQTSSCWSGENVVYSKKSCSLEKLRYEMETANHAIPVATLKDVTSIVRHWAQQCLEVDRL